MNREDREGITIVRTPIPGPFARAFQDRAFRRPIPLARAILTPQGIVYYRPPVPYTATLATWSGVVMNAVAVISYSGRIDSIKVSKAEIGLVPVPATAKADGQTFEIWVEATNLSSQAIKTGVEVIVTKPDGYKVAPAIDWTFTTQGVNVRLTFKYNIAAVNQTGNWTAVITYYAY